MGQKRTTMTQILSIPDPLFSDNFELVFDNLPSTLIAMPGLVNVSAGAPFSIQCRTVAMPGISNEAQDLTLHGFKVRFTGRTIFSGQMQVQFVETKKLAIYNTLYSWVNVARRFDTQTGSSKSVYAVPFSSLYLYDETGTQIQQYYIGNIWCESVQELNLDGSNATIVDVSATFSFDYFGGSKPADLK